MNEKKSLGLNATLNVIKSIMGMVFPLITYPYVSRVLQPENIGKVNYSSSIVSYFMLFAMLGIKVYATREGARIRNDKIQLEKFVAEIYTFNIITGLISIICLTTTTFLIDELRPYKSIILLLGVQIPLAVIGTDWINSIFEDYLYITVRTIVFQVIALVGMFTFVKNEQDYIFYAACIVVSAYGSEIINAFYTKKYCRKRIVTNINLSQHLKPIMLLFATNLSSLIYSSADTTMLGWMTTDYDVGIYGTASKIYDIFKRMLFAIIVVCLPRFSNMFVTRSREEYSAFANKMYGTVYVLSLPLAAGIFCLSNAVVDVIAGPSYYDAIITLQIKCIAILFAILAYFNMQLILLPARKDSWILRATLAAGLFNIVANFALIPKFQENGAAITTAASELIVFAITRYLSRYIVHVKVDVTNIVKTIIATLVMISTIVCVKNFVGNSILQLMACFFVGVAIYFTVQLLLKNPIVAGLKKDAINLFHK